MTTEVYKMGAHSLATYIMKQWIKRNWWIIAIPPAICIALAIAVDIKFAFIALIMVFIMLPPAMITVYFYHALAPEARMTILPHRVTMTDDGLTISYEPPAEDIPARDDDFIGWSRIKATKTGMEQIAYRLDSGKYCMVLIPRSAFKTPEHYNAWIMMQDKHVSH